jgi:VanZ family protein
MPHPLSHRKARWALLAALVAQLAVLAYVVFHPDADMPSSVVRRVSAKLSSWGVPDLLADTELVEFALNVLMFVPIGATLALLLPRVPWWLWALVGLAASSSIEALQLVFLSDRSATLRDVAANTLGLVTGGWVVHAALHLAHRRTQADRPQTQTQA